MNEQTQPRRAAATASGSSLDQFHRLSRTAGAPAQQGDVILQVRDLSERHARDLLQDEQRMQLFPAQKLEALGQLSGGLAQDFNELLTIILSASALAGRSTDETREQRMRPGRLRLELGVELHAEEPGMIGDFDDFDE